MQNGEDQKADYVRYKLLIFIAYLFGVLGPATAFAGIMQVDAGVTSDYVWRGLTQTRGKPAVSGGVEYVMDSAWYFGAWASNSQNEAYNHGSAELDLYVGLSGQGDSIAYDFGFINYQYPAYTGQDFTEMYFAFMTDKFAFKYSDSTDAGTYMEVNLTYKLAVKKGATMTVHAGNYSRNNNSDYFDYNVSLKINEFSFTLSQANIGTAQDKDMKAYVSLNYSF